MSTKHTELQPVIRYESACQIVEHVVEQARNLGKNVCAVVVDPSGTVVSAGRMSGVPAPIYDYAADKAYTAGTLGKSTSDFHHRMSSSPALSMGVTNRSRLCTWPGGLPILEQGRLIGGLGVSGATDEEDVDFAVKSLTAMGLS